MRVAIADIVSDRTVKELSERSPFDVCIYRNIENPELKSAYPHLKFVDYSTDLTGGIDYAFNTVRDRLEKLKKKNPGTLKAGNFDLLEALNKELMWAEFDDLLFDYNLKCLGATRADVVSDYRRTVATGSFLRLIRSFFYLLVSLLRKSAPEINAASVKGKVAIRLNNQDLIPLLGYLPETLGADNYLYFRTVNRNTRAHAETPDITDLSKTSPAFVVFLIRSVFSSAGYAGLKRADIFLQKKIEMCISIRQYDLLCRTGVASILLNAGENEGEGNMMAQVARRFGVKSANFMNGAKAFDSINQGTEFDLWFMHDQAMQEKVAARYQLDKATLPVTGHLMEDKARNYRYSGSLDKFLKASNPEFIIAFFTSPLFSDENNTAYEAIARFLDQHPRAVALLKPHPRDKEHAWNKNHPKIQVVDFRLENFTSETVLFDLFSKAQVAISIASTVSYQASWFGIRSYTFELRSSSRLPHVDGEHVKHLKSAGELLSSLNECYLSGLRYDGAAQNSRNQEMHVVAQNIVKYLKS